jgi:hypothetical protein
MSFDWTILARNAASLTIDQLTICTAWGAKMPSEVRRRLLRHRHFAVHRFEPDCHRCRRGDERELVGLAITNLEVM